MQDKWHYKIYLYMYLVAQTKHLKTDLNINDYNNLSVTAIDKSFQLNKKLFNKRLLQH